MTGPDSARLDAGLLAFAEDVGLSGGVAVEGGRTRWARGGPSATGTRLIRAPCGIVAHEPAEMTVRVGAGTRVSDLHAALAEAGQLTALPHRGGTIGGALSVGENGLDVLARGPVRNSALQVTYVSSEGELVVAGGPTVKNVSGFNLPKLLVGSLGTLGLMAEVILRTNPVPPASEWLCSADLEPQWVLDTLLRPAAILWDGETVWVHLEGHEADVAEERGRLESRGTITAAGGPPPLPPHRWSLTPADAARAPSIVPGEFVALIGVGTVHASTRRPDRPLDPGVTLIADRAKKLFDPTGRLNPGRNPARYD